MKMTKMSWTFLINPNPRTPLPDEETEDPPEGMLLARKVEEGVQALLARAASAKDRLLAVGHELDAEKAAGSSLPSRLQAKRKPCKRSEEFSPEKQGYFLACTVL